METNNNHRSGSARNHPKRHPTKKNPDHNLYNHYDIKKTDNKVTRSLSKWWKKQTHKNYERVNPIHHGKIIDNVPEAAAEGLNDITMDNSFQSDGSVEYPDDMLFESSPDGITFQDKFMVKSLPRNDKSLTVKTNTNDRISSFKDNNNSITDEITTATTATENTTASNNPRSAPFKANQNNISLSSFLLKETLSEKDDDESSLVEKELQKFVEVPTHCTNLIPIYDDGDDAESEPWTDWKDGQLVTAESPIRKIAGNSTIKLVFVDGIDDSSSSRNSLESLDSIVSSDGTASYDNASFWQRTPSKSNQMFDHFDFFLEHVEFLNTRTKPQCVHEVANYQRIIPGRNNSCSVNSNTSVSKLSVSIL